MFRRTIITLLFPLLLLYTYLSPNVEAATLGTSNMSNAEQYIDQSLTIAEKGDLASAQRTYQQFRDKWLKIEDSVKHDSSKVYSDIESNMGQVEFSFLQNKQQAVIDALRGLQKVNQTYMKGEYSSNQVTKQENITLPEFIDSLKLTQAKVQNKDQQGALHSIEHVRQSWLSVEGVVVAQSATIYNDSERDMVTIQAMIVGNDYEGASKTLNNMIVYLTPLASKTTYTLWDAALIPIREGMEALLVVAALLTFVKKSNKGKGKGWIWSGVTAGLLTSMILAVIIKFVFSSGTFGNNNSLISGWTGVIAAIMLLYVSYWLHSQANTSDWNQFIRSKSKSAMDTGRLISLGFLAFLAIFREGTETVLFLIGMVNQISTQNLILGLLLGFGVLLIIAFLMLFIGVKLPLKPFFMVSSIIVFYLCLKFTGMGVHSLQLAGVIPSSTAPIPSFDFLAVYPSWQSILPQSLLVLFAICSILVKRRMNNKWKQNQNA